MSNLNKLFRRRDLNDNDLEFEKKILTSGNNKFGIIGEVFYKWIHWFWSADGTPIMSICVKDDEGNGGCFICEQVDLAYKIIKDEEGIYSKEEIERAEIMVGDLQHPEAQFKSSSIAKIYAFFNVIDLDDTKWCEENKHTVVLCKSDSQIGISAGKKGILGEFIDVCEENGDYEDGDGYTFRIKKSGKKKDTEYKAYKNDKTLTDEQKEYGIYDFEKILTPTNEKFLKQAFNVGVKKDGEKSKTEKKKVEKKEEKVVTTVKKPKSKFRVKVEKKVEKEPVVEEEEIETGPCPGCDKQIPITSEKCPHCKQEFEGYEEE